MNEAVIFAMLIMFAAGFALGWRLKPSVKIPAAPGGAGGHKGGGGGGDQQLK
jgi:hypothetical protein